MNLRFDEEPLYAAYIALFEPLLGAAGPARPLQVENAVKVRGCAVGGCGGRWGCVFVRSALSV